MVFMGPVLMSGGEQCGAMDRVEEALMRNPYQCVLISPVSTEVIKLGIQAIIR